MTSLVDSPILLIGQLLVRLLELQRKSHLADHEFQDSLAQPKGVSKINEVTRSQPLCTAIQIALVVLLRSWGIRPSAVVGHSSGTVHGNL